MTSDHKRNRLCFPVKVLKIFAVATLLCTQTAHGVEPVQQQEVNLSNNNPANALPEKWEDLNPEQQSAFNRIQANLFILAEADYRISEYKKQPHLYAKAIALAQKTLKLITTDLRFLGGKGEKPLMPDAYDDLYAKYSEQNRAKTIGEVAKSLSGQNLTFNKYWGYTI